MAAEPRPWLPGPHLLAVIAAAALVRGVVAANAGLTEDEAYYRLWALAPAWSHLDHPPMVGWLIAAGRFVAGDTALGIRLMAVLVPVLGALALRRTALILFDRATADLATLIALVMPLMVVGGIIITPDTPSVLFWGLAGWAVAELAVSGRANWWLAVGVFAGLGLLSKYTNLFVGAGIGLWLLATPTNRRWLASWQLWAGGALALAALLPVLAWNAEHDWASFDKQLAGRVGAGRGPTLKYLGEMVGAYLGLASPVLAVFAALGLGQALTGLRRATGPGPLLLVVSVLPLLAFMLVQALQSRVQPNWLAPLYPALAVAAALAMLEVRRRVDGSVHWRRAAATAVPVAALLSATLLVHTLAPLTLSPRDPTAQLRGWPDFARNIEAARLGAGAGWIATSNYATTGQLAYQLRHGAPVVQLNERLRYVHLPPPSPALLALPALYVELARNIDEADLARRFRVVAKLPNLTRSERGVMLADYAPYRLAEPIGPVLDPVGRR